jgi:hypothetical protein
MKKFGFATLIASGLTAAVLGFAGPSSYHVDNHDEVNTTNGFVDVPF